MINTELAKLKLEIKLYESIELDEKELQLEQDHYVLWPTSSILELAKQWATIESQVKNKYLCIFYEILRKREPKTKNLVSSYQMFEVYLIVPQLYKQLFKYVNS